MFTWCLRASCVVIYPICCDLTDFLYPGFPTIKRVPLFIYSHNGIGSPVPYLVTLERRTIVNIVPRFLSQDQGD